MIELLTLTLLDSAGTSSSGLSPQSAGEPVGWKTLLSSLDTEVAREDSPDDGDERAVRSPERDLNFFRD